ncbi:MAG: 1-phosphofructokinase family hexose kinase [Paracoccaceae bacterium]
MTPIATVTLNPALDLATATASVAPGRKLRCEAPRTDPGGGGINVSRVIRRLGGESLALVALAGATGERLKTALEAEGIIARYLRAPGETRESLSVIDRETGEQYRFVMPGAVWTEAEGEAALDAVAVACREGALVVLSGSLPPGLPADLPARLARRLVAKRARLILDTSGATLAAARRPAHPVMVLRMDEIEAEALAQRPLPNRADTADFAQALVRDGAAEVVIIARGSDGSVLATEAERHFCRAAKMPVVSKTGAGDSFLAAFTLALAREADHPEALSAAVAAASAAVMTEATELCSAEDAIRLIAECPCETV